MIRFLAKRLLEDIETRHTNVRALNYTDRSQGIRVPDAPVGFLASDQGIAHMYAGSSKLMVGLKGRTVSMGHYLDVRNYNVSFKPQSIGDFLILGKHLDPEIFWSRDYVVVNRKSFEDVQVITPDTRVDLNTGEIINTKPLSDYFQPAELFPTPDKPQDLEIKKTTDLARDLGIPLPNWL